MMASDAGLSRESVSLRVGLGLEDGVSLTESYTRASLSVCALSLRDGDQDVEHCWSCIAR